MKLRTTFWSTSNSSLRSFSGLRGLALLSSLNLLVGGPLQAAVTVDRIEMSTTGAPAEAAGGGGHDSLAAKLSNPLAAMISVPFQNNFDFGGGPRGDGTQWKMNVQPVIPFSLNEDWNLITRVILPVVSQEDIAGTFANPSGTQSGLGDTLVSMWASPVEPTSSGWIWGIGPALSLPTGTNDPLLGSNQWAAGPTAVVFRQREGYNYALLVNHLWSYAGTGGQAGTNNTFLQPVFNYLPGGGWTYSINSESSYNWQANQWTVPINLSVRKMFKIGKMPAQWEIGGRYYVEKPDNGPEWGFRLTLTMLFPRS